jgi:exosortase
MATTAPPEDAPGLVAPGGVSRRPAFPWRAAVVGACLALAYLPLLAWHAQVLWDRPHYQFVPLLVPGAAVLAWLRVRHLGPLAPGPRRRSAALLAASVSLLAVAALVGSPWLGMVAALLNLLGLAYTLGGRALLRAVLPACLFLGLAVPPPLGLDLRLIVELQGALARVCSRVLDVFGVYHVRAGNVIEAGGRSWLVDEACAGAQSFYSLLACALFFVLWTRCSWLHGLFLLAGGLACALAANLLRVVALVVLPVRWHLDVSAGWRHEALGVLSFGVCLLLVWSTHHLLLFLTPGRRRRAHQADPAAPGSPAPTAGPGPTRLPDWRRTALGGWAVPLAYGALAVVQLPSLGPILGLGNAPAPAERLTDLGEDALPARHGAWERAGFETEERGWRDAWGRYSHRWPYRRAGLRAVVSLDYPFTGWHDLAGCYQGVGWHLIQSEVGGGEGDGPPALVRAWFDKPRGRQAYLWFGMGDGGGRALTPADPSPEGVLRGRFGGRLGALLPGPADAAADAPHSPYYQVQLFLPCPRPLTADERQQAEALFQDVRRLLGAPRAREDW